MIGRTRLIEKEQPPPNKEENEVDEWLSVYSGVWTLEQATALLGAAGRWSDWRVVVMISCMLLSTNLGGGPNTKWLTVVALALSCILIWERIPFVWPSWWWCLQTDTALPWCLLRHDRIQALHKARNIVRWQFGILYLAAGFVKLNTAFLDPRSSCSTVFVVQLVAKYAPQLAGSFLAVLVQITPLASAIWEMSIGLTMLLGRDRFAIIAGIGLHTMISATPVPNNISTFSAKCVSRYFFLLLPHEVSQVASTFRLILPVYLAVLFRVQPASSQEWALSAFAPMAVLLVYIVVSSPSLKAKHGSYSWSLLPWILLALINALIGPLTGLQDLGAPTMYSNFKVHGGSNHFLLPTGLLRDKFASDPDSIFFGGVVRVEATTSSWIAGLYPNELTADLEPKARIFDLLTSVDYYAPRFFNGAKSRVLGSRPTSGFVPFTVPAFELRRLLDEASQKDATFSMTLAQLPGDQGDEYWRSMAVEHRLHINVSEGSLVSCFRSDGEVDGPSGERCSNEDLILLDPSESLRSSWRFRIARKILVSLPYPVLDPPNPQILCFGP